MISCANESRRPHADIHPIKLSIFNHMSDELLLFIANTCGITRRLTRVLKIINFIVDTPKRQTPRVIFQLVWTTSKLIDIYKRQDADELMKSSTHPQRPINALKLTNPVKQTVSQASPAKKPSKTQEDSFAWTFIALLKGQGISFAWSFSWELRLKLFTALQKS